jgi:transcriptional regulator with XRE-family HTH domain
MSRESINPAELRLQIGRKLKQARLDKGLSQKELGEKLGITRVVVGMYERGRLRISIQLLLEISRVLVKPIQYFVEEDPDVVSSYENSLAQKNAAYNLGENLEFSMEMSIRNYLRSQGKKGDINKSIIAILDYIKDIEE